MAEENNCPEPPKCPECPPAGLPGWMATFSDMVTLLLTFFILLYALSKQDESKFRAMAGSIREAFGGNTKNFGDVVVPGKSPSDSPTMIESEETPKPFPIDFLTSEGLLDKLEVNRESTEDLNKIQTSLSEYGLTDFSDVYELNEGIKVRIKDKIFFRKNSIEIDSIQMEVFKKLIKMFQEEKDWKIFVEGYATSSEGVKNLDPLALSSKRAETVVRYLIRRGVMASQISSVFYGDARPLSNNDQGRVEFVIRKVDLTQNPTEKYVYPDR